MKKLGKLSLKEMEDDMSLMGINEQRTVFGGSVDDNDCFFEALVYIGSNLGYNNQSYQGWMDCYGSTYGSLELFHAVTEGVYNERIMDFLNQNFNSASYISLNNFNGSNGTTMGYLNSGADGHAVIVNYVSQGMVNYTDPQTGEMGTKSIENFYGAVNIQ